jgi:iron(III) transport system ATP-binding protein
MLDTPPKSDAVPAPAQPPGLARGGPIHLRIHDLTKRFGAFTALDRVSLEIPAGTFVCFLGPSGCGKTTLLRAIAGLDRQDSGRIELGGQDVSDLPPAARDFGIVFQSYALFPNLTIAANVGYGLANRNLGRAAITARVTELLALVDLADQARKYPAQLSGGQQQRVALARALATSPSLLLLDEPLSALDARVRVRLREEIKALQRRLGVTTVMVTHDQEEALSMADRIVVMNHGTIEQIGTPRDVYADPASLFVADFVGTMTVLEGVVAGDGRVEVGGLALAASSTGGRPAQTAVKVGFRPEEVQVRGVDERTANHVACMVADLEFLGSFCRATLQPIAAPTRLLTADFSANLMRDVAITPGSRLDVALAPQTLRVFDANSGARL